MKTVLFLEDNFTDMEIAWRILRRSALVTIVRDRVDYIQALIENKFDLIIIDLNVPTFLEFETLKIARSKQPEVPTIVLTGSIREEQTQECLDLGAFECILKHNLSKLELTIRKALKLI